MPVSLHESRLGDLTTLPQGLAPLGLPISLPATYTISIWVKDVQTHLDGSQEWSNLFQQTAGPKYVLDAHYGRIGAGQFPTPEGRLSLDDRNPLMAPGTWHLITVTYNGSEMGYFANGNPMGTSTFGPNGAATAIDVLNGPGAENFAEEVRDLRIYTGVASNSEILASYNNDDGSLIPGEIRVRILQTDSYGDTWNGGSLTFVDSQGATIGSFYGPAEGFGVGLGLYGYMDVLPSPYQWTVDPGGYPSEITITIDREDTGEVLANLTGSSGTGVLDFTNPIAEITASSVVVSGSDATISVLLNPLAIAAGGTQWAHSISPLGAIGQPHGGTLVALNTSAVINPSPAGWYTVYLAAVDSSGNVIAKGSTGFSNAPPVSITVVKFDTWNDSWDGSILVVRDSVALEVHSSTLANGASPETILVDLPPGNYTWGLEGGSYQNEHSVTITLTSDGSALATSVANVPSYGSFTIPVPAPAVPSISVFGVPQQLGGVVTLLASANSEAIAAGATHWAIQDATAFVEGGTHSGSSALLASSNTETYVSGGNKTIHIAALDGAGLIIAVSSVVVDVLMPELGVGSQIVLFSYLNHPSLDALATDGHPLLDAEASAWGPFYIGELSIKTLSVTTQSSSSIECAITIDDGSGGTLDMDWQVAQIIQKYKLNELGGRHAVSGQIFQSIIDGTAPFMAAELLSWDAGDTSTVMVPVGGGGWIVDSDLGIFASSGTFNLIEYANGTGYVSGPDGSTMVGIVSPGEAYDPLAVYQPPVALAQYPLASNGSDSIGSADATQQGDPVFETSAGRDYITLDGDGDYMRVNHDASNAYGLPATAFSVSAWFKASSAGPIFYKGRQSAASHFWGAFLNVDGSVTWNGWHQSPDAGNPMQSERAIFLDDKWHQIVVTHEADGKSYLYVDGNCEAEQAPWTTNYNNTDYFNIGGYFNYTWGNQYFNGSISDVSLWGASMGHREVSSLYESGIPSALGASSYSVGDDVTISVNPNSNALAIEQVVAWAFSVDTPLGALGNPHGGTQLDLGSTATITVAVGPHDIYAAGLDASGNVVISSMNMPIDTTPMVIIKFDWYANHWSGFNSRTFELLDSGDNIVHSVSPGAAGAGTASISLYQDTYKWRVVAYRNDYKDIEDWAQATFKVWQIDTDEYGSDFLLLEKGVSRDGNPGPFTQQASSGVPGVVMQGSHSIVLPLPPEFDSMSVPVWESGKTYQWAGWQSEQNVTTYEGYADFSLSVDLADLPFSPVALPSSGALKLVVDGVLANGNPFTGKTLIYTYTGLANPGSLYSGGTTLAYVDGVAATSLQESFWNISQLSNYDFSGSDGVTDTVIMALQPGFPNIASPNSDAPIPGLLQPGSALTIKALQVTSSGVDYDVLSNLKYASYLSSSSVSVVSHSIALHGVAMAAGFVNGDIEVYTSGGQLVSTYADTTTVGEPYAHSLALSPGEYYLKMKDNGNDGMFTLSSDAASVSLQVINLVTGLGDHKSVIPTVAQFLANPETHDGSSDDAAHARLYFGIASDLGVTIPSSIGASSQYIDNGQTPIGWTGQVYDDATNSNVVETWHAWPTGAQMPSVAVESPAADWTLGGELSDIVQVVRGEDPLGLMVLLYAKNENNATRLYTTTKPTDFGTFNSYALGTDPWWTIAGAPLEVYQGSPGQMFLRTDSNNLYEITIATGGGITGVTADPNMASDVFRIRYDNNTLLRCMNDGKIKVDDGAGGLIQTLDLSAEYAPGTVAIDIAGSDQGWCVVSRNADMTFNVAVASSDWSEVAKAGQLNIGLDAVEVNYVTNAFSGEKRWYASDGVTTVSTTNLLDWLVP
jgi:hypothetical protein